MMWPFDSLASRPTVWLALYLVTLAIHLVLISYVVGGTAHALIQALRGKVDPVAERARDLLPFMLGLAITAGVAPLLFLQLLYQRRFYSANLVLGPRWGAVVPALIVGFYLLYLAKATLRPHLRRVALGVALACFLFVAWSWTEIHLLMQDEPAWRVMYAAAERVYDGAGIAPRVLAWLGIMAAVYATLSAWLAGAALGSHARALAILALVGRVVTVLGVVLLVRSGAAVVGTAHGWAVVLVAALGCEISGWLWMLARPSGAGLALVTGAGAAGLLSLVIVREAPRLVHLEAVRGAALEAGGLPVFACTAVFGVLVIAWVVRTIRDSPKR